MELSASRILKIIYSMDNLQASLSSGRKEMYKTRLLVYYYSDFGAGDERVSA